MKTGAEPMNDQPRTPAEVRQRAVEAHKAGDFDAALAGYRRYLSAVPRDASIWSNLGALHRKRGEHEIAVACQRRAHELDPALRHVRGNLANALSELGLAAEALDLRLTLLDEDGENPDRAADVALSLRGLRRNEEAVEICDAAEARYGYHPRTRLQRGFAKLMLGDYAGGFLDYEARYDAGDVAMPPECPWPRWQGEDLADQHILVFPEQGFGDALFCARFLPALRERAGRVTMIAKPPLIRLLGEIDGVDAIIPGAPRSEHFDLCTPNMSLPTWLGVSDPVPAPPRLTIPEDSRRRARSIAAPHDGRVKIGIVWTGSLTYGANHRRSVTPERFLPLAEVPGVQLFSLYKGDDMPRFQSSGMGSVVIDACSRDRDFADTAAVIDEMDFLITTDTAVVHVAGSLGKEVWNMIQYEGFWLYGDGETTPWYPSMRIFRQERVGDWDGVFEQVEAALREKVGA